jgi:hypothetical protein
MNEAALFTTERFALRRALGLAPVLDETDFAARVGPAEREPIGAAFATFKIERWAEITFDPNEEWLIKRIMPRSGTGAIYGKPESFKSFIAMHIGLCVALGRGWAGRRVHKAPVVYLAAEGAAGLRKRKTGYVKAWKDLQGEVDFALVSAAPNLGTDPGDLPKLFATIEAAGIRPGLIVIDTLAKTLGAADENGSGMTAFIGNAGALAQRFNCFVLIVHHVGHNDDKRLRGHSSLPGGLDVIVLCERMGRELRATLALQKLKDEASDVRLMAALSRAIVGHDEDGEEASTLIVDDVLEAGTALSSQSAAPASKAQRLLMSVVVDAIDEAGQDFRPFGKDGPLVRAIDDDLARERYYARIAEKAEPNEDPAKLVGRQRKAFNRNIKTALDAVRLMAASRSGKRLLWLP